MEEEKKVVAEEVKEAAPAPVEEAPKEEKAARPARPERGPRGDRRRGDRRGEKRGEHRDEVKEFEDRVVFINRVSKTVTCSVPFQLFSS